MPGSCLIAEFDYWFLFSLQGADTPAAGNLEFRPAWWSPSRGTVGSDAHGHATAISLRGAPLVYGVGLIMVRSAGDQMPTTTSSKSIGGSFTIALSRSFCRPKSPANSVMHRSKSLSLQATILAGETLATSRDAAEALLHRMQSSSAPCPRAGRMARST